MCKEIKDTGHPAFPVAIWDKEKMRYVNDGMTLRDYFAAKAMATLMIGAVLPTKESRDEHLPLAAAVAYEVADALLAARQG